jgi:cytochrome o ubiquinol oxidase operon protein cyoD
MTKSQDTSPGADAETDDKAPGQKHDSGALKNYAVGLAFAVVLTLASFWAADSKLVWGPSVPVLLAALAIGQMGVHLVFFLHISSAPDNTNNVLALAFGVFVVGLVVFGSLIIMKNLNEAMMPVDQLIRIQR